MKNSKGTYISHTLMFIAIIFIILGLSFMIIGSYTAYNAYIDYEAALPITAVISRISEERTYITYEFNDKVYEGVRLSFYASSFREGQHLQIRINPEDPTSPMTTSTYALIFVLIGSIFFILGVIFIVAPYLLKRKNLDLLENGSRELVPISHIERNHLVKINEAHPWQIFCRFTVPAGNSVIVSSENFRYDPSEIVASLGITHFPLYYEEDNPRKYYLDVSEIKDFL